MSAAASPCVNVCVMDEASGLCHGCLRTLNEIAAWPAMSEAEKREVLQRVDARRARLQDVEPAARGS